MRWWSLFADLEAQLEVAEARDRLADVPEMTRAERAGVALADRLRGEPPVQVRVTLRGGEVVSGRVTEAGPQWLLLVDGPREHVVPAQAVVVVTGVPSGAAPPPGRASSRLTLGHVLRAVARDRGVVRVSVDGASILGRVDAVGADHVDLALAHPDSGRPTGERCVVPWSALLVLSRL